MFNRKILAVQTDWGGEYERLNSFFRTIGVSHHVSCPHAHQQNGAAERKHRHIVEMSLALLANASMPLKFWDQAFLTATHLINRTPTKILDHDTPLHRLLGATPDYSNLRVFGCACWPNLRPYNTHKLQFRSLRCAFLGYSNLHKGYKCLDISTAMFTFPVMSSLMKLFFLLLRSIHVQEPITLMMFFFQIFPGRLQIYHGIIFLLTPIYQFLSCCLVVFCSHKGLQNQLRIPWRTRQHPPRAHLRRAWTRPTASALISFQPPPRQHLAPSG
jgi:hypothetical protein